MSTDSTLNNTNTNWPESNFLQVVICHHEQSPQINLILLEQFQVLLNTNSFQKVPQTGPSQQHSRLLLLFIYRLWWATRRPSWHSMTWNLSMFFQLLFSIERLVSCRKWVCISVVFFIVFETSLAQCLIDLTCFWVAALIACWFCAAVATAATALEVCKILVWWLFWSNGIVEM